MGERALYDHDEGWTDAILYNIYTRARRIITIIIIITIIRTYYYITRVYTRSCIIIVYVILHRACRKRDRVSHRG